MSFIFLFAIFIGGGIGVIAGGTLLYIAYDETRWRNFMSFLEDLADNRLTRPLFYTFIGPRLARMAIQGYVRKGEFKKAEDLAVSEGLVDETIDTMEARGSIREAARLAKRMAREDRSQRLYRTYLDMCLTQDLRVLAAEVAEEAEFWPEAIQLLRSMEGRGSRLQAAKLAAQHDETLLAVEIFLTEEALLDAMRVAQKAGQVEFVLTYCSNSDNPVLHHFGADTARQVGRPEMGLEILLSHGHLHPAAQFAQQAGLKERAKELMEQIQEKRSAIRKEILKGRGGPFGFDFSDDILEEPKPRHKEMENQPEPDLPNENPIEE
jgi:hypothetical protein